MGSRASADLGGAAAGAAVSWAASATCSPGGRGAVRRVHRSARGAPPAPAAAGHRSLVDSGTARARVGTDSTQHTHPGADPFCGCDLDHPGTARGLAPTRHCSLRPTQVCTRAHDEASGVSDGLVRFCWSQCHTTPAPTDMIEYYWITSDGIMQYQRKDHPDDNQ